MDTFNHLRSSVVQTFKTFECHFDSAYETLNAELATYDERVRRAEEHARMAEEAQLLASIEVEKLKSELAVLHENPPPDVVSSDYIEKSLQLEETYSPRHVFGLTDGEELDNLEPDHEQWKVIAHKYLSLYKDAQTLVNASGTFREQIRRQKQKLVDWQKCLHRDDFTLTLDGTPVTFKKVPTSDHNLLAKAQAGLAAAALPLHNHESLKKVSTPPSSTRSPGSKGHRNLPTAQNKSASTKHQEQPRSTETDDLASTQSASSPIDEGAAIERRAPDGSSGTGTHALKRKRTDPSYLSRPLDSREDLEHAAKVIKSECISPSPPQTALEGFGMIGTQDLDEVGNTVETPTKRKTRGSTRRQRSHQRTTTPSKCSNILQPVNSNIRPVTGTRSTKSSKTKSPTKANMSAISSIAEDGDENHIDFCTRKKPTDSTSESGVQHKTPGLGNDSTRHRLFDLLDQPFSRRQPLLSQRNSSIHTNVYNDMAKARGVTTSKVGRPGNSCTAAGGSPKLHDQDEEQQLESTQSSAHQTDSNRSAACSEDIRYRNRPLHRLELGHFKINPDYNQGMDFAFNEIVRKKHERKCLSGCMRPGCCGDKFRAMARIGAQTCSPAEEQKVLEEYMGNDRHLLDSLSKKDRENLLHEAKAKSLADAIGKHRHHHQRPNTPPGFWRTDMPDTQELEHDREEAKVREREKVKNRYRAAMRPGGLWKFADE